MLMPTSPRAFNKTAFAAQFASKYNISVDRVLVKLLTTPVGASEVLLSTSRRLLGDTISLEITILPSNANSEAAEPTPSEVASAVKQDAADGTFPGGKVSDFSMEQPIESPTTTPTISRPRGVIIPIVLSFVFSPQDSATFDPRGFAHDFASKYDISPESRVWVSAAPVPASPNLLLNVTVLPIDKAQAATPSQVVARVQEDVKNHSGSFLGGKVLTSVSFEEDSNPVSASPTVVPTVEPVTTAKADTPVMNSTSGMVLAAVVVVAAAVVLGAFYLALQYQAKQHARNATAETMYRGFAQQVEKDKKQLGQC
jgi:hypothetical protein